MLNSLGMRPRGAGRASPERGGLPVLRGLLISARLKTGLALLTLNANPNRDSHSLHVVNQHACGPRDAALMERALCGSH